MSREKWARNPEPGLCQIPVAGSGSVAGTGRGGSRRQPGRG